MSDVEAFAPQAIASQVETRGVAKANASATTLFVLGVLAGAVTNLAAATIGNLIGGGVLVGLVYRFVYLREPAH